MAKKNGFKKLLLSIIGLLIVVIVAAFVYKTIKLDYKGSYASETVVYEKPYGFVKLINFKTDYIVDDVKGIAITNIPFASLFSKDIVVANDGTALGDSKDILGTYQFMATFGNNNLVDSISKLLSDDSKGTKSIMLGKRGYYFLYDFKDIDDLK